MWTKTAVEVDLTERGGGKGWHYAQVWSTGGGPIGYCAEHAPHATEEQARLCYTRWLINGLRTETYGDWTGCQVESCDKPTKHGMMTGYMRSVALCEEHLLTRHAIPLLGLNKPAGDSMGS